MIGRPALRLLPPERQEEERVAFGRLLRGERLEAIETTRLHQDGEPRWVRLSLSAIKNPAGEVVGLAKIARDITARKLAELTLREAKKQLGLRALELEIKVRERTAKLQETVGELEAFSYSLSHDMRAPLRAIQSFAEIVLADHGEQIGLTGAGRLKRVISAAQRMERLIEDVLAYSRVSRRTVVSDPIDVEKLIEEIIAEWPEFQPPKAEIVIQRPLLPVVGHAVSLSQCLTNLLDNAVKFVAPGVTPRVRVRTEPIGEQVRLWVEDNGIGIEPAARRRLFAMFQRVHSEREYAGTGIGLVIIRKAAERMGGEVGVESEPGKGSRFWLQLPKVLP
jgi:signal transduction histidine kinase